MTEERKEFLKTQFKPATLDEIYRIRDMFRRGESISSPVDDKEARTVHYLFDENLIGYETHTNILTVIRPQQKE